MRIVETKIYKIGEHPAPKECFEWIRQNWNDLNDHNIEELVDTLNSLKMKIGGSLDYSISQSSDRGGYIMFRGYDKDELFKLNAFDYPLTGCFWDFIVIRALKEENTGKILSALHEVSNNVYSDEGLRDLCESNEYEFDKEGNFYPNTEN